MEKVREARGGQVIDCLKSDDQNLENDALMNRKPVELLNHWAECRVEGVPLMIWAAEF